MIRKDCVSKKFGVASIEDDEGKLIEMIWVSACANGGQYVHQLGESDRVESMKQ